MAVVIWLLVAVAVLGGLAALNYVTRARVSTDRASELPPGRYFAPGSSGGEPPPGWTPQEGSDDPD